MAIKKLLPLVSYSGRRDESNVNANQSAYLIGKYLIDIWKYPAPLWYRDKYGYMRVRNESIVEYAKEHYGFTAAYTYGLMRVYKRFSMEECVEWGITKLMQISNRN